MSITLRRLRPTEFALNIPALVDIHLLAMNYGEDVRPSRMATWRGDTFRPGFTAIIAEAPNGVVGVAYGFLGTRESWWDRQLRSALVKNGKPLADFDHILSSYFEVAEIHVHPQAQGHGIGRALLTELLWNVPAGWALLSTPEVEQEANRAFGLYRSMGFHDIIRHYLYPGDARPFAILGVELPLRSATS